MDINKLLKSIGWFFLFWIGLGFVFDLLGFGQLSGLIGFIVGILYGIKKYREK